MRMTEEQANYTADAAKKLQLVKKGYAWLFMPHKPGATYHSVHWVSDDRQSVQCEGKDCPYCPRKPNPKVHVPCLLYRKWCKADKVDAPVPTTFEYTPELWRPMIIELTKNCFTAFKAHSEPGQLGIAFRPGPMQNGKLYFKWLDSFLQGVPASLEHVTVQQVLPGVIGGTYRDYVDQTLTDDPDNPIKHNPSNPTIDGDNGART